MPYLVPRIWTGSVSVVRGVVVVAHGSWWRSVCVCGVGHMVFLRGGHRATSRHHFQARFLTWVCFVILTPVPHVPLLLDPLLRAPPLR